MMKKFLLTTLLISLFVFTATKSMLAQVISTPTAALQTEVQAAVGEFYLNLSGYVSPFASLTLTSDGIYLGGAVADANGNFVISQILINAGFSSFCIDAIDFKRIGESYTCFTIPPATASVTMNNIFLPPTLGLSRTTINAGGSATAFGYTMPKAKVTLHFNNVLFIVYADANGYYEVNLKNVPVGTYSLYSTANYQQKDSLVPTKKLQLTALSKSAQVSQQVKQTVGNWWDQLLRFLRNWLWNPLWLAIPILILIIILIRKLWGKHLPIPVKKKSRLLHHSWWMGY
jgi:hypothetical protein